MKKVICGAAAALAGLLMLGNAPVRASAATPECKAAYSCDWETGTVISAHDETKRLPIASMCKIMTLLLSFEAEERGEISCEETVTVSENAAGMGGSQVFLDAGLSYPVGDLLKSIVVCSANDSCVAMAERLAGSESSFVDRMNERAKELGAENTLFANCTGLPKEPQYSCAKDVAVMLKELTKHEKYFTLSKVWCEDFAHPDGRKIQMANTNKLVRYYEGCDGGKTGYTSEAGSCLAATAKRGDMRLISVVIGAENSKTRNALVSKMFDEGFQGYENKVFLRAGEELAEKAAIEGSSVREVALSPSKTLSAFGKKGGTVDLKVETRINDLRAPVKCGDTAGTAILFRDGVEIDRCDLLAMKDVDAYSWWDAFRETAKHWN